MTRDDAAGVILERVLDREGGISYLDDGAGLTAFGQTPAWLTRFGFRAPATREEALANYRTWLVRMRLIGVCDQPDSFADVVVDWAVNAGHAVAIHGVQLALGIHADGILGPETQATIDACDRAAVSRMVMAERVRFYGRLVTGNPALNARWCAGWLNRIAAQIEVLS